MKKKKKTTQGFGSSLKKLSKLKSLQTLQALNLRPSTEAPPTFFKWKQTLLDNEISLKKKHKRSIITKKKGGEKANPTQKSTAPKPEEVL